MQTIKFGTACLKIAGQAVITHSNETKTRGNRSLKYVDSSSGLETGKFGEKTQESVFLNIYQSKN